MKSNLKHVSRPDQNKNESKERLNIKMGSQILLEWLVLAVRSFEDFFEKGKKKYEFVKNHRRIPRPHLATLRKHFTHVFL